MNKKLTIEEMGALPMHSKEWFSAAFEGMEVLDFMKLAAERICHAYGIRGQADPGYIANTINQAFHQSQGLYTYQEYAFHIAKYQQIPPGVKKVMVTPESVEVKSQSNNCVVLEITPPYQKLIQVGENLQLYWVDIYNNPTSLSYFWLTELFEVDKSNG